jgi:hypothetical protein
MATPFMLKATISAQRSIYRFPGVEQSGKKALATIFDACPLVTLPNGRQ